MPGMLFVPLALVLMPVIPVAVAETLSLAGFFPISTQPQILAAAHLAVHTINDKSDGISLVELRAIGFEMPNVVRRDVRACARVVDNSGNSGAS